MVARADVTYGDKLAAFYKEAANERMNAIGCNAATAGARPPTITLRSVTLKRSAVSEGYAGTVSVRVRLCLSLGPQALLTTRQVRKAGGITKAQETSTDPLGVDLDKVYPYKCSSDYGVAFPVRARLFIGGGTYSMSIRVRDGYGRTSAPVFFSVRL